MEQWPMVPDVIPYTIATVDGQLVNPFTVTARDGVFRIETIAHALSNLCRYAGHTSRFYSVAEHCLLVECVVTMRATKLRMSPERRVAFAFEALVHDAVEAYLGDIPAPFKRMPEFAPYRAAEARLAKELRNWFGLVGEEPQIIKDIDVEIRGSEREWLMSTTKHLTSWTSAPPIPGIVCGTMSPNGAKEAWLRRFDELQPAWTDHKRIDGDA